MDGRTLISELREREVKRNGTREVREGLWAPVYQKDVIGEILRQTLIIEWERKVIREGTREVRKGSWTLLEREK